MSHRLVFCEREKYLSPYLKNIFLDERSSWNISESLKKKYFIHNDYNEIFFFKNREKNFEYCEIIFKNILKDLSFFLNKKHNLKWSIKSWEILIGFWLRKFIYIVFYNYNLIKFIINNYNIKEVTLAHTDYDMYCSQESSYIQDLSINKDWLFLLRTQIFNEIKDEKKSIKEIKFLIQNNKDFFFSRETFYKKFKNNQSFKSKMLVCFSYLLKPFCKKNNGLILSSYLNLFDEKILELMMGQTPFFYKPKKIKYDFPNIYLRENLSKIFLSKNASNFEKVLRKLLFKYLPIFILENFNDLIKMSDQLGFPKEPKFIFTSNSFESDELFKVYLSKKKYEIKNLKYFVGQHGNSYITRIDNNYQNEVKTCDFFFSWGNFPYKKVNIISTFNFKNTSYKRINKANINNYYLYFILRSSGYQTVPYDRFSEGKAEYDLFKNVARSLPKNIKKIIRIKPHYNSFTNQNNFLSNIISKDLSDFKIITEKYSQIINNSKLICFCYDSTGFLENLAMGIPCVCLMPNYLNHLNDDVKHVYINLKKVNVIFDSKKAFCDFINSKWNTLGEWWSSAEVQDAINDYLFNFSSPVPHEPLKFLKNKIEENLL